MPDQVSDLEYKFLPQSTKDVDGRSVIGIASVFGNIDAGGDIIHRGAFKKTIGEGMRRVKHLWQHDSFAPPVAVIKNLEEVGRSALPNDIKDLFPDAKGGLQVEREYLDTERGNEVLTGVASGAITEMSIGYTSVKVDYEEVDDGSKGKVSVRNLRELRLYDTSDVNWGMNSATSASKSALDYRLLQIEGFAKDILTEFENVENVYDHLEHRLKGVDKDQLANELEQLMTLLRAEPPMALTPQWETLARIEIAKRLGVTP